jgi:Flp pilus assembly protein TadB
LLYRLSPADSVVVRRSLLGYNRLGALNVLLTTFVILLFLLLLPAGSSLVGPVVLSLLLLEVLCTAVGTLVPRLLMGRIIRRKKEEEMEIPQTLRVLGKPLGSDVQRELQ